MKIPGSFLFAAALASFATTVKAADPIAYQQLRLPQTSYAIDVSGDTVVIGDRVFTRSGGAWAQQAQLTGSNTVADDNFGASVAISGDTLVIGATGEDSGATGVDGNQASDTAPNSGAVYVFTRSGTVWTQQAYLKASNTGAGDGFGSHVAISGDTIVVSTVGEDSNATGVNGDGSNDAAAGSGAAYVFVRNGNTWAQEAYLKASNTAAGKGFGTAVDISGNGVVVGASASDGSGGAYIFNRSGTTWTQEAYFPGSLSIYFGSVVGISGDTVVVGAPRVSGNGRNWFGAADIYVRSGSTWALQASIKNTYNDDLEQFGYAVAISGDTVAVSANWEDSQATGFDGNQADNFAADSGAVFLFKRNGTTWTQQHYLKAPSSIANDAFGMRMAMSDGVVLAASFSGIYVTDIINSGPEIHIKQGVSDVFSGGTVSFGPTVEGTTAESTFTLANLGVDSLSLTGTPKITQSGSNEFSVTAQPGSPLAGYGANTPFKVRFAPTSGGLKTATLSIPSTDADEGVFTINLAGTALSFTTDTDGDGLNDAAEFNMAALNFNWQVAQPALVNTYFANAGGAGFQTRAQIQALYPGKTLVAKSPSTGRFKVSTQWQKSGNLTDFFNFPAPAGSAVSISPSGKIEFEFAVPDKAAFFRAAQP